jgi:hypothetical protein
MSGEVDRRLAGGETDEDADQVSVDEDAPVRMTDAEERFAMRLAEDLERVLGAGIGIADLEISGDGPVHVRAALLAEGAIEEFEATGETSLDAYRALVQAAAELRLAKAFWRIVTDV